jgi:hypothetical protein
MVAAAAATEPRNKERLVRLIMLAFLPIDAEHPSAGYFLAIVVDVNYITPSIDCVPTVSYVGAIP